MTTLAEPNPVAPINAPRIPFMQKVYHLIFCYDDSMSEVFGNKVAPPEVSKNTTESKDKRISHPRLGRFKRAVGKFFLVTGLAALLAFGAQANEPDQNQQ